MTHEFSLTVSATYGVAVVTSGIRAGTGTRSCTAARERSDPAPQPHASTGNDLYIYY
jgi:hypothetical protein